MRNAVVVIRLEAVQIKISSYKTVLGSSTSSPPASLCVRISVLDTSKCVNNSYHPSMYILQVQSGWTPVSLEAINVWITNTIISF